MPNEKLVANHYAHGGLLKAIGDGIAKLGKTGRCQRRKPDYLNTALPHFMQTIFPESR